MARAIIAFLLLTLGMTQAQERPKIPEDLLDDEIFRSQRALNEYTVPSIAKVFDELEKVSPLAYDSDHLKVHERFPFEESRLALRLGTLIADGFIAVQTGNVKDVKQIASLISRYGKALRAGDRINIHAAALLEYAEAKDLENLKLKLAATQRDVERELASLENPDLSHLISLGGWLRALDSAARAVDRKFTPDRAVILFREDVADYYSESLGALDPARRQKNPDLVEMQLLLQGLRNAMALNEDTKPTAAQVKEVTAVSSNLLQLALK